MVKRYLRESFERTIQHFILEFILFAPPPPPPPEARAIFLHNDLLCNGTCSVTGGGGGHNVLGGGGGRGEGHKRKRSKKVLFRMINVAKTKLDAEKEKKLKQIELQRKIHISTQINQQRLKVLKHR